MEMDFEVPDLDMTGLGGFALEHAFATYGGLTGKWPASMEDLAPYYPWLPLYEGFEWGTARNLKSGLNMPIVERDIPNDIISRTLQGHHAYSRNNGESYDPPLGVFGNTERYVIREILAPAPTPEEVEWLPIEASTQFEKIPRTAQVHSTYEVAGIQLNQRDYMNVMTGVVIEQKALMLSWAMSAARGLNPAGVPVHTFAELLSAYDAEINPAFWVNPYTGAPMQDVPLTARTAGDYTTLPDAKGLQIAFHYLDFVGEVSTIVVGAVGTMDECCNLDTILPPQESSPQ